MVLLQFDCGGVFVIVSLSVELVSRTTLSGILLPFVVKTQDAAHVGNVVDATSREAASVALSTRIRRTSTSTSCTISRRGQARRLVPVCASATISRCSASIGALAVDDVEQEGLCRTRPARAWARAANQAWYTRQRCQLHSCRAHCRHVWVDWVDVPAKNRAFQVRED